MIWSGLVWPDDLWSSLMMMTSNVQVIIFTSEHKRTDKHVDIVIISELSSDLQNDVAHFIPQFFMVFEYRPIYSIWNIRLMQKRQNYLILSLNKVNYLILSLNKVNYRQKQQFFESNRLYDHFGRSVQLIKIYQM